MSTTAFSGFATDTTPVPSNLIDLLAQLTGAELRALLYIMWRSLEGEPIDIPFAEFYKAGLYTPTSAGRALAALERKGCIKITRLADGSRYALRFREVQS